MSLATRKIPVLFLGTSSPSATALQVLHDFSKRSCYEIVHVVTQPPARGRRSKNGHKKSCVHTLADKLSIPVSCPRFLDDDIAHLSSLKPALAVTAAYGQILSQEFLDMPPLGTLNIHPSLLPQYRGAAPVQRAIVNKAKVSGVTILQSTKKVDAGPILFQVSQNIGQNTSTTEYLERMFGVGGSILSTLIPDIAQHHSNFTAQNSRLVSKASKLKHDESLVNVETMTAETIHDMVRAFTPWPGVSLCINSNGKEQMYKIWKTSVLEQSKTQGDQQRVDSLEVDLANKQQRKFLKICCADNSVLGVSELQQHGGKRISAMDFSNGAKGSTAIIVPPDCEL
jgi:methionyl-tRNA formyltransferase